MSGHYNVYRPIEIEFFSAEQYEHPFDEIDVNVEISKDNRHWTVPAYWAGDDRWCIRFSAPETGCYIYKSVCSNRKDAGLHEVKGFFEVTEYTGNNPFYVHGPVCVTDNKRYFCHEDGTPFFWLGDTWWNLASSRMSENEEVQELVADRLKKNFTVISMVNAFWCDLGPYDKRLSNAGGYAWKGNFDEINPAYYDILDKKIEIISEAGLLIAMAATWGFYIKFMGLEKMKKHIRYMIARYAAYPVVWLTAGEVAMPFYDYQKTPDEYEKVLENARTDWTEALSYLKSLDPYHRLITAHVTFNRISTDDILNQDLLDFIEYQAAVHDGNQITVADQVHSLTKRGLAVSPVRPVVNSECCYEGMLYRCGAELQRWLFWHTMLGGCAGWTYGANGMFTASHEKNPFGYCYYGTNWGEQSWQEAMHFEGAKHAGYGAGYLSQYHWWKLNPLENIVEEPEGKINYEHTISAEIPGTGIMTYIQRNIDLYDPNNYPYVIHYRNLKPGRTYQVKLFNPIRNYELDMGEVSVGEDGRMTSPTLPIIQDWVIVLLEK